MKSWSDDEEVTSLPLKKCGRPFLLGEHVDKQVQLYLMKTRAQGGVHGYTSIVVAAAHGIILAYDRSKHIADGGHIDLSRHWAYHLLDRMKSVRRKVTTAMSK